VIYKSCMPTI